mgnify:CR=1 FL=1
MAHEGLHSWVEISRSAYAANIAFFRRRLSKKTRLALVVKANAYGHGMLEIAGLARENGVDLFCVHSIEEAAALRRSGFTEPILLLGPVPLSRAADGVRLGAVSFIVYDEEHIASLAEAAQTAGVTIPVHLKVETGTNRQGTTPERLDDVLAALRCAKNLYLAAVYSHFANIEDTTDHSYALRQITQFNEICERIRSSGFSSFERHIASSAAAILFPETHLDVVRIGIAQYGLWPSKETLLSYRTAFGAGENHLLRPVLSWKARITQIKEVPAGSFIGYGCTYQTTRHSRIAILSIGYFDGYDRRFSNSAHVLVKGHRAPVRGRVAMNLTAIDITDVPAASLEEEVTLIGRSGDQEVTAEYLAALAGTINYEIVTRIAPHLPRIVTE